MSETMQSKIEGLEPALSQIIDASLSPEQREEENELKDLFSIALEALNFRPPRYIKSILGSAKKWLPPHDHYSEFTIADLWHPLRLINFVSDITLPAFSHKPKPWVESFIPPIVQNIFWRPSDYFQQSDPFKNDTSFLKEHWFFINGVATNESVAKINSALISKMFLRPVTVVHNQTNSLLLDLIQCAIGKEFKTRPSLSQPQSMTEPAVKATVAILKALIDPEREKVVLISHSQGTIITANVLRALKVAIDMMKTEQIARPQESQTELDLLEQLACEILGSKALEIDDMVLRNEYLVSLLKKLEVYTFANCANKMTYITHISDKNGKKTGLPFIENFANEFDLVARLGILSPYKKDPELIKIDGMLYLKQGKKAWGHLLNEHYLLGVDAYLKNSGEKANPYQLAEVDVTKNKNGPRLYGYFNGERQLPYFE